MTTNEASDVDRYAVIGYPVHHSRSPQIHRRFALQTAQRLSYELVEADAAGFEDAVRGFRAAGGKGMNVTVPHKQAAFRLATETGVEAAAARAVNTLRFDAEAIRGDNTDGIGFMRDLVQNLGREVEGRRILILGAGGAARGILGPLLTHRPAELVLANRTPSRALRMRAELADAGLVAVASFEQLAGAGSFDVVVNATSSGLLGEVPAFPRAIVGPRSFCYDLSYAPGGTAFVRWALACGAAGAAQGWGMLVEQAAESFFIWRGVRPETVSVIRELEALSAS